MNLRKLLYRTFLPFLLLLSIVAIAQKGLITGRVTDASGRGVAGVSIAVRGQTAGTTSTENGSFTLTVPENATALVFTSVGYGQQEVNLDGRTTIDVTLQSVSGSLNEVVVVGYEQDKEEI
jgi:iron complex outermembrane receptor protein